ncbi:MAG TPA: MBL fold metallo-hydrolase [Turneriella sp.]|nr:MBL fold metallo-hydrolase [Turneriella sp.]
MRQLAQRVQRGNFFAVFFIGGILGFACHAAKKNQSDAPKEIYALKYGESLYSARLVNTRQTTSHVKLNWLAYLIIHHDGTRTLVDTGFSDKNLLKRFAIQKFKSVPAILALLHIDSSQIQRIILTHTHFDHALDLDLFSNAKVFLHKKEFSAPQEKRVADKLKFFAMQGKVQTFQKEITHAGLTLEFVGGHTQGSIVVKTIANNNSLLFTGDECYFAESCFAGVALPSAAAFDVHANRRFIESIKPQTKILTGHEIQFSQGEWLNDYIFRFSF